MSEPMPGTVSGMPGARARPARSAEPICTVALMGMAPLITPACWAALYSVKVPPIDRPVMNT